MVPATSAFRLNAALDKRMPEIFLSIGSNISPETHILSALKDLMSTFGPLKLSSYFRTAAIGFEGPAFINLVARFESERPPLEIAKILRNIEEKHGRTRHSQKFSSRTLDVDLILYGDTILKSKELELPRPEIDRYAFVLEPLAEIAPEGRHPISGKTYKDLWAHFDKEGLQQSRLDGDLSP